MLGLFRIVRQKIAPSYLGVDIGTTSIKMAEVARGERLPKLVNYGILESSGYLLRSNNVLQTSTLKIFEDDAGELTRLLKEKVKPKTTEAVASLPAFAAFMTTLNFPPMSPAELQKSMAYQAREYIPLPISEVAVDWMKVGEYEDEKGAKFDQVLLISVPQEQIRRYQNVFKKAGLRLRALEVESLSAARILCGSDPTPTVLVDIGSRSTNISVVDGGELRFNSQSDFAGASLTEAVSKSLSINPLRAEELKKERGVAGTGPNYELSTIMLPFLDVIIGEVKKAQFAYQNQFPQARKIERAMLSGGGANLIGVEKYFESELGIPSVKASPLAKFDCDPSLGPIVPELNPLLAVSLGLAVREFV